MGAYSERYSAALFLAARAHRSQNRKGSDVPYIVHPVLVSILLLRYGFSEDVTIAGLLHDVVEDQGVPLADIEAKFGPAIAEMVGALTERKREGTAERPWKDRKREALDQLRQASSEAVAVKAADVLHNARHLASDLRREGASIWSYYKRGPEESLWYYRSVAGIVRGAWGAHPLADELESAIQDLEHAIVQTQVG